MELFKEKLRKVQEVSEEELEQTWIEFGVKPNQALVSWDAAQLRGEKYPEFSRDTGAGILDIVYFSPSPIKLKSSLSFAADSLFCEWCYVIDFDKNTFEIYEEFNKEPLEPNERFYFLSNLSEKKYYPVRHVKTFDLFNLPILEEFLEPFKYEPEEE